MNILGIDTCTETIDVALLENGKLLSHRRGASPRQQLTKLMPYINEIFNESSKNIKNLDLIAITTGPGSFTGVRLGIATAKTLCQLLMIPAISVNTLEALAMGSNQKGIIISSMDARKSEIFYGVFKKEKNILSSIKPYNRVSVDDYFHFLSNMEYDNPVVLGSVFWRYSNKFDEIRNRNIRKTDEYLWTPQGEIIARMGLRFLKEGKTLDYNEIKPFYGRAFEAIKPKPIV